MKISSSLIDYFFRSSVVTQFIAWLLLIFVLKFDSLLAAPVWDTAMGVFPPAIFLYENNFDILSLIQQDGWWEGGPNVHSLSLWTWIIAALIVLTENSTSTFFILHVITFAVNALAISLFVRTLHLIKIQPLLAFLSGLVLLFTPMILVQIGYMYTESLVMALSILVWVSWHHQREGLAVFLVLIAITVKTTGVVIGLALCLVLLLRLISRFSKIRLLYSLIIPVFIYAYNSLYYWLDGKDIYRAWTTSEIALQDSLNRFERAPDISLIIGFGILSITFFSLVQWYRSKKINPTRPLIEYCARDGSMAIVACYIFGFVLGVLYMTYQGEITLLRYLAPIIPFAWISILSFSQIYQLQKVMAGLSVFLCLFFIYNHNGVFYGSSSAFSIVENSHAYKGYVMAQSAMIDEIVKLNDQTPIYVSREIDYMVSHPMMGYLDQQKPNIIGIYKDQYSGMYIEDFPPEFYVVMTNSNHGGQRLKWAIIKAEEAVEKGWQYELIHTQSIDKRTMTINRVFNPNLL